MIFYGIIRSAIEIFRDFCPFISEMLMKDKQTKIIFIRPGIFINQWIEMIVPSTMQRSQANFPAISHIPFSTLFSHTSF